MLGHQRYRLTEEEEVEVRGIGARLLAEVQGYELPLNPEEKPRGYDVVRLLRPRSEHNLGAVRGGPLWWSTGSIRLELYLWSMRWSSAVRLASPSVGDRV